MKAIIQKLYNFFTTFTVYIVKKVKQSINILRAITGTKFDQQKEAITVAEKIDLS